MKKRFLIFTTILLIICCLLIIQFGLPNAQASLISRKSVPPIEGSKEELYRDVIITMLLPYIDIEVEKYYGKPYIVAPYSTFVKSITRPYDLNYTYQIKLEITPYWGPHNTVGIDQITFEVSLNKVEVKEFKHLKSYDLPEHLR